MRWDWPKQKLLVENGEVGDCWRCCIAAILQIPAEEVPHFVEIAIKEQCDGTDPLTQSWLNARGYWFVSMRFGPLYCPRRFGDSAYQPFPYIASGPSVRSKTEHDLHAVVMADDQLLYDPHPSDAGLLAVVKRSLIVPFFLNMVLT